MKDLGALKLFLIIEVVRSKTGILSQRKYVIDLLTEIGMFGCKLADTPIEMNHKLCEDMELVNTNKEQYQHLVGKLIYLAHIRPDIAYAGLLFSKNGNLEVIGYTNADWAGSITDKRSTSGYFTFVRGNLVT
ncbi:uncharacterized mitochondrial protein AtMg00810-like [Prunus dulcis]|uniref:uncharacterized mitochondrial protein AtMg00810-like n=1 Tax=Prunus dulcis TaxID=3755 RepID=UPI0014829777|nr:uncharacterized mitochondrial protein AtMg00810-like [Prunus dulcis]